MNLYMNLYQCMLVENGIIKENIFKNGETAMEVLDDLRAFAYGDGEWKIYLGDELELTGTS